MGRWLLVTGAATRLGGLIATAAAEAGWNIVLHFHNSHREADETVDRIRRIGVRCEPVNADLASADGVDELFAAAWRLSEGSLLGVVNSASIFQWDDIASFSRESFESHQRLNALAPILLSQKLYKHVRPGDLGAVVNILDFKLDNPNPDYLSYTISKFTLAGATAMLARALAPRLRVNAVSPGFVLPAPGQSEEDFLALSVRNPLQRIQSPLDVAKTVVFLLNCDSITGQDIVVDCGLSFFNLGRDVAKQQI